MQNFKLYEDKEKINFNEILCFSDVMDNLSNLDQLKIVEQSKIADLKKDKSQKRTIVEYSTSKMAIIDSTLYVTHESIR